jgi:hypothetical protein
VKLKEKEQLGGVLRQCCARINIQPSTNHGKPFERVKEEAYNFPAASCTQAVSSADTDQAPCSYHAYDAGTEDERAHPIRY